MIIRCPHCDSEIAVQVGLAEGQHVICPCCGNKFAYSRRGMSNASRVRVPSRLSIPASKNSFVPRWMQKNARLVLLTGVAVVSLAIVLVVVLLGFSAPDGMKFKVESVNHDDCEISTDVGLIAALETPQIGVGYVNAVDDGIRISRIVEGEGVIAASRMGGRELFVTTRRGYVDGMKLAFGVYVCNGTVRIDQDNGLPKTIWSFEEMDKDLAEQRLQEMVKKKAAKELQKKKLEEQEKFEERRLALKMAEEAAKAQIELDKQKKAQELELSRLQEEKNRREEAAKAAAELETKKAREEADRKAEEARQRRYPAEQRQRQEYAAAKLSDLSFRLAEYFVMQKDLKRYLHSATVTEKRWNQFRKYQAETNWLAMLSLAKNEEMRDFPALDVIDSLVQQIAHETFHAEFKFVYGIEIVRGFVPVSDSAKEPKSDNKLGSSSFRRSRRGRVATNEFSDKNEVAVDVDRWEDHSGEAIMEFSIETNGRSLIYAKDRFASYSKLKVLMEKKDEAIAAVENNVKLGKITKDQGESERARIKEMFVQKIWNWMETSKVSLDGVERIRGAVSSSQDQSGQVSEGPASASDGRKNRSSVSLPKKRHIDPRLKTFR